MAADVTLAVSDLDPSLILKYDFEGITGTTVKDSTAYGRDGTIHNTITQTEGVADGKFGADLNGGTIDIPIDDEFYELIDDEITIAFWAYIDPVAETSSNASSYLLKGTKTYGSDTYNSLRIRFQTKMVDDESYIWWENGIYTQGSQTSTTGNASTYKLKLTTADHGITPSDINDQWVHWTFTR